MPGLAKKNNPELLVLQTQQVFWLDHDFHLLGKHFLSVKQVGNQSAELFSHSHTSFLLPVLLVLPDNMHCHMILHLFMQSASVYLVVQQIAQALQQASRTVENHNWFTTY